MNLIYIHNKLHRQVNDPLYNLSGNFLESFLGRKIRDLIYNSVRVGFKDQIDSQVGDFLFNARNP